MKLKQYFDETPKIYNVLTGLVIGAFGLLILFCCSLMFFAFIIKYAEKDRNILIIGTIFFPVGISCVLISWKLLTTDQKKKHDGLFPPAILFIFGFFFLFTPIILFSKGGFRALESITFLGGSIACFALAKIRYDKKKKLKKSITNRSG